MATIQDNGGSGKGVAESVASQQWHPGLCFAGISPSKETWVRSVRDLGVQGAMLHAQASSSGLGKGRT